MALVRKSKTSVLAEVFYGIGFFSRRRAFFWLRLKKRPWPECAPKDNSLRSGASAKTDYSCEGFKTHGSGRRVVPVRQFFWFSNSIVLGQFAAAHGAGILAKNTGLTGQSTGTVKSCAFNFPRLRLGAPYFER